MTSESIDMVNLISGLRLLMNIGMVALPLLLLTHILIIVIRGLEFHPEEPKPKPLAPSKAIAKMLVAGEKIPEWIEKLGKYEKQGVQDKKIQKSISKLERVLQKEIRQYNENLEKFKDLKLKEEPSLIQYLTKRLEKQKEVVLELGQEILILRVQDETVNRAYNADKLVKKMDKELSGQVEIERVRETVSETVRSVEEQVLRDILSSTDTSTDMRERAEQLLPHFKGVTKAEQQLELKNMDYEIDLQTLERIVNSKIALDKNEKT